MKHFWPDGSGQSKEPEWYLDGLIRMDQYAVGSAWSLWHLLCFFYFNLSPVFISDSNILT